MTTTDLDLGKYKLGWSDEEDYVFKPKKGLNESIVREMSAMKKEPEWMRDFRLRALSASRSARWPNGSPSTCPTSTSRTSTTTSSRLGSGRGLERPARRHQEHLREAGHPRGGAQVPGRRDRPVRVGGRLPPQPRGPRGPGHHLLRHGHRGARVPRPGPQVLRDHHPAQRQQVRRPQLGRVVGRLVHLRPAQRGRGPAPAGLLPDQRREHGPVRADADHRRRRLPGALHRGVLGPGVHQRLAALGGGGAGGPRGVTDHLHHHPELVQQRLQPGDQAGPGRGRGPRGVDRRQHRLPPDHEVPERLPDGARRPPARCSRWPTPAPASIRTPGPR